MAGKWLGAGEMVRTGILLATKPQGPFWGLGQAHVGRREPAMGMLIVNAREEPH